MSSDAHDGGSPRPTEPRIRPLSPDDADEQARELLAQAGGPTAGRERPGNWRRVGGVEQRALSELILSLGSSDVNAVRSGQPVEEWWG